MSASIMPGRTTRESTTDPALVAAYRAGDQRAATELVRRHASALGRFLYSSGAPQEDVEDLVQEALFRAFRRVDTWTGEASFRGWLLTIGSNLLRDQFRKRTLRLMSIEDTEIADSADPHGDLAAGEIEDRVRAGLSGLPHLQREVFLLRVQEGVPYTEIAELLDTTPGAARVHYHQAVKRLKELVR